VEEVAGVVLQELPSAVVERGALPLAAAVRKIDVSLAALRRRIELVGRTLRR
jgi:hypothetical protein